MTENIVKKEFFHSKKKQNIILIIILYFFVYDIEILWGFWKANNKDNPEIEIIWTSSNYKVCSKIILQQEKPVNISHTKVGNQKLLMMEERRTWRLLQNIGKIFSFRKGIIIVYHAKLISWSKYYTCWNINFWLLPRSYPYRTHFGENGTFKIMESVITLRHKPPDMKRSQEAHNNFFKNWLFP